MLEISEIYILQFSDFYMLKLPPFSNVFRIFI